MNLKILSKNDLKLIFKDKNEVQKLDNDFMLKYSLYRKLFTEYIINKYKLKDFDKKIENSNLKISAIEEKNMDFYQYFSNDELKYLFVRNDLYIERLTEKETKFLEEKIKSQSYVLDEITERFIEETYVNVISRNNENTMQFYGPTNSNYLSESNSIVIGYRYDEFADNGLNDEEWDKLNDQQFEYLHCIIETMLNEIRNIEKLPVSIIKYNEFSIIPRNEKQDEIDIEEER